MFPCVYISYSKILHKFREDISANQVIIPIGLVSSGMVSNLYLHDLDIRISNKHFKPGLINILKQVL